MPTIFTRVKQSIFLIVIIGLSFTGLGLGCKQQSVAVQQASKPITLTWWRVFDDEATVQPIIDSYRTLHPNITIVYRKLRYEDYERELLNALAEDRGPDIVSLQSSWLKSYAGKLLPMPRQVTLPYQELQGSLKKEIVTILKTTSLPTSRDIKNNFVDAVVSDIFLPGATPQQEEVYGLPLGIDTLALYSNRDLLNLSGIPQPPRTWTDFQGAVKKLTKFDKDGTIVQAGATIGTSKNVERAQDVLALLMMQNGATMLESGQAVFDRTPQGFERPLPPGEEALTFYTDFANSGKEVYTWNATMPRSFEAFVNGKVGFFLGYSYHLPSIKARAPKLNFEISPVPQIEGNVPVNFANYFVESVSRKSQNPQFAWDFINFATSMRNIGPYLDSAKKPTALRALVAPQSEDPDIGVFVSQTLTSRTWYHGMNALAAEQAILDMIDAALAGTTELRDVIRFGAQKVTQTLQ